MSDDILPYVTEPNRVLSNGAETLDAVGLSFEVDSDGIYVTARTGSLSKRTIEIAHDDIRGVDLVETVAFGIEIETLETTYTVTNVAATRPEAERVLSTIRRLCIGTARNQTRQPGRGESRSRQQPASTSSAKPGNQSADTGTSADRSVADGSGTVADGRRDTSVEGQLELGPQADAADETLGPGDTLQCHDCGHKTAVPTSLPDQRQDANCPKCGAYIGYSPEEQEYIVVDPDP